MSREPARSDGSQLDLMLGAVGMLYRQLCPCAPRVTLICFAGVWQACPPVDRDLPGRAVHALPADRGIRLRHCNAGRPCQRRYALTALALAMC